LNVGKIGDAFGAELLEVAGFVVRIAIFPAAEEDADPFERQAAAADRSQASVVSSAAAFSGNSFRH
jgi:hypothetical protein